MGSDVTAAEFRELASAMRQVIDETGRGLEALYLNLDSTSLPTDALDAFLEVSTLQEFCLVCDSCEWYTSHDAADCPHFKGARDDHPDAKVGGRKKLHHERASRQGRQLDRGERGREGAGGKPGPCPGAEPEASPKTHQDAPI